MRKNILWFLVVMVLGLMSVGAKGSDPGCDEDARAPAAKSDSGVGKATVQVPTQASGLTTEQENVRRRLIEDNQPGAIKHLYVISAMSGQVILYSTVKGKVTSSGKRLSPTSIVASGSWGQYGGRLSGYQFHDRETTEVLQDDGTYGSSVEYIYWFDSKDAYHQHYISGGQIVHVSSQPLAVKHITINIENPEASEAALPDKPTDKK